MQNRNAIFLWFFSDLDECAPNGGRASKAFAPARASGDNSLEISMSDWRDCRLPRFRACAFGTDITEKGRLPVMKPVFSFFLSFIDGDQAP